MKAVVVCALLFVVAACALETLPKRDEPKVGHHPKPLQGLNKDPLHNLNDKKINKIGGPSSSSGSGSGSSSQHKHGDPKVLALKAVDIFGDADGSAAFKGANVLENTIAEVATKQKKEKKAPKHSKHSSSKKESLLAKLQQKKGKGSGSGSGKETLLDKLKKKKDHAKTKKEEKNPRTKRQLFNFKDVPQGADSMVLRKHHFSHKHHRLVTSFANKHHKTQLVLVVDAYVSPAGRPSKKRHDTKKRGHRKSDVNLRGVRHNNVFIFDDKGKQLFPAGQSSSSSGSRSSSSGQSSPKAPLKPTLGEKKIAHRPRGVEPLAMPNPNQKNVIPGRL